MNNDTPADAITQADRLAAADLIEAYWSGSNEGMMKLAKSYRAGHSHGAFVRAFAKHRAKSLAAQDGLVDALRDLKFICGLERRTKAGESVMVNINVLRKLDAALASIEVKS